VKEQVTISTTAALGDGSKAHMTLRGSGIVFVKASAKEEKLSCRYREFVLSWNICCATAVHTCSGASHISALLPLRSDCSS
jgi:predicted exporter